MQYIDSRHRTLDLLYDRKEIINARQFIDTGHYMYIHYGHTRQRTKIQKTKDT